MSYRALTKLGLILDRDFALIQGKDGLLIEWRRKDIPAPTQAEIDAADILAAAAETQAAQDKSTLDGMRDQVKQAISMLSTIQGAASFTNAQRDAAIKELAQIVERFIRVTMEQAR